MLKAGIEDGNSEWSFCGGDQNEIEAISHFQFPISSFPFPISPFPISHFLILNCDGCRPVGVVKTGIAGIEDGNSEWSFCGGDQSRDRRW